MNADGPGTPRERARGGRTVAEPPTAQVPSPTRPGPPGALLRAASGVLDEIVAGLESLANAAAPLWEGPPPRGSDLAELRPVIQQLLARHGDLVVGAGVAVGPDDLADEGRHLEWWWSRGAGGAEALRVNLDPSAPDFYDFVTDEWFRRTVETGEVVVAGPVVDYACTNDYALTVGHPIEHGGDVVAVAAADVPIERLEARLLPVLAAGGEALVVVNADGRVVLSTTATLWPGARLDASVAARGVPIDVGPLAGWRLVHDPDEPDSGEDSPH